MSERMIELQRQKMGLPPLSMPGGAGSAAGGRPGQPGSSMPASSGRGGIGGIPGHSPVAARHVSQPAAVAAMQSEDRQLQTFIHRLQYRDDSQMTTDSSSGPTVPTALSRRILHRQGVGYLDNTVAAIASASADRFLATVLHQALACRNQRLEGCAMAREAKRHRKRHLEQYEADILDRRRRRQQYDENQEKINLKAIENAENLKKGAAGKDGEGGTTSKSKKKKKAAPQPPADDATANGNKKDGDAAKNKNNQSDDEDNDSYNSVDEEEQYYQQYYKDNGMDDGNDDNDSDDEEDETLMLTDVTRPLRAWDFHLTGKLGCTSSIPLASDDVQGDETKDDDGQADDENREEDANAMDIADGEGSGGDAGKDGPASPSKSNAASAGAASGTASSPASKQ